MADTTITMDSMEQIRAVFGDFDKNINLVQKAFSVTIFSRGSEVKITGDDEAAVNKAEKALKSLGGSFSRGETIDEQNVRYAIAMVNDGAEGEIASMSGDCVCVSYSGKPIKPKTVGQKKYCDLIRKNTITFGVGPAGTGKTYLAVALAVTAFKQKQVQRIILTRPAVEAGEKLGFLPGDMKEKLDPYLQPLYDALNDMIPAVKLAKYMEEGTVQIAPLAYMRGRTLDNAFVILDEAQNTTMAQIKMFLTRMGRNARFIVTGDVTQIDLPKRSDSGLLRAMETLEGIAGIGIVHFGREDIVRHPLVKQIVDAFGDLEKEDEGIAVPLFPPTASGPSATSAISESSVTAAASAVSADSATLADPAAKKRK